MKPRPDATAAGREVDSAGGERLHHGSGRGRFASTWCEQALLPAPAATRVYRLTEMGRELERPLVELCRWGDLDFRVLVAGTAPIEELLAAGRAELEGDVADYHRFAAAFEAGAATADG